MQGPAQRRSGTFASRILTIVVAVSLAGGACSKPEAGSPGAACLSVSGALQAGDMDALYALLADDLQAELGELYETMRETVTLVDQAYAGPARETARAAAGAALLERVEGPESLFRELSAGREPTALSSLQRLGSAPVNATVDGDNASVRTRAGDVWQFRRAADGTWRWVPPEADRDVVRGALERARQNRQSVRAHIERLAQLRERGIVRPLSPDTIAPAMPVADDATAGDNPGAAPSPTPDTETPDAGGPVGASDGATDGASAASAAVPAVPDSAVAP